MNNPTVSLLNTEELKLELENLIPRAQSEIIIISAFVTRPAISWLQSLTKKCVNVQIICRLTPSDIKNGSTELSALRQAIQAGWKISRLRNLHAKIYLIDKKVAFVGSANLTNNGLKIWGEGNLEASVKISINDKNMSSINSFIEFSHEVNENILNYIEEACKIDQLGDADDWNFPIFSSSDEIWVQDTLWFNPLRPKRDTLSYEHDCKILNVGRIDEESDIQLALLSSRLVRWLFKLLDQSDQKMIYFGSLTAALHNDLRDDPGPYRKDVKSLVENLLSYCKIYLSNYINVTRPNYSEKVSLKKNYFSDINK
jgi:HKD family nuclease